MAARSIACVALFASAAILLPVSDRPAAAQGQAKGNKGNPLDNQLRAAQNDYLMAQRQIAALRQENAQLAAANNKLQAAGKKEVKKEGKEDEKNLKALRSTLDGYRNAGLVHVVVLKAKADIAADEIKGLIDESSSQLAKFKTVRGVWAGKPSAKPMDGAAADYTVAIVLVFDDAAGLKTFLDDPVHQKFMERHLKKWETPLVYDFEPSRLRP